MPGSCTGPAVVTSPAALGLGWQGQGLVGPTPSRPASPLVPPAV